MSKLFEVNTSTATMALSEKWEKWEKTQWVWVMSCLTTGCDTGEGAPFKTVNESEATATALLEQHIASAHTTTTVTSDVTKPATKMQMDPELAKEQALRVNAKKATNCGWTRS